MKNTSLLYYTAPAESWTQALPIGNGTLGAMIFGGVKTEKLALNHDELWTGKPKNTVREGAPESFEKARKLALEGDYHAAREEIESNFLSTWSQAYLPLGDLIFEFDTDGEKAKKYRRYLDISSAVAGVEYTQNGTDYRREFFASYPHKVIAVCFESSAPSGFTVKIDSKLKPAVKAEGDILWLEGECPGENVIDNECPRKTYFDEPENRGILFRSGIKVITDGLIRAEGEEIAVSGARKTVMFFACVTSFNGFDRHPFLDGKEYKKACEEILEGVSDYEKIKKTAQADYESIYSKVSLEIDGESRDLPTDKRLTAFRRNKNDTGLIVLMYNYGRYLAISSSRPGSQPSNLQGIWSDRYDAPWNANYTVNINTEMNYWPVLMTNMQQVNEPLVQMIKELSVTGREAAKGMYNAAGWCSHHNVDLWRLATPVSGNACWAFWHGSSGWLCRHLFEHYEYSGDTDFLKNTAYPIMKGAAEFYLDIMTEQDGEIFLCPGTSPENGFRYKGKEVNMGKYSTMSMSIARDLFRNIIKASEILGTDKEFAEKLKSTLEKMHEFKTGSDGQLLEYDGDYPETEKHHRHVSHLYALHPADIITPEETPELAKACRRTLERRGDNGTGWSLGWKINFWARLNDGNHALKLIEMQLRPVKSSGIVYTKGGGTYENLFDAHPPFQIDGNFGFVRGVTEMLLRSSNGKIYLLPALPDSWPQGEVRGIKAKGNITVDIVWENGKVKDYRFYGKGKATAVINGKEVIVNM